MTSPRTLPAYGLVSGRPHRLLVMLAAALLLLLQALVLEHQLDLEQHADGHTCEFCLHLSPLDHSLLSSPGLPQRPVPAIAAGTVAELQAPALPSKAYQSRAPPRLS